jgi:hypothetical protein
VWHLLLLQCGLIPWLVLFSYNIAKAEEDEEVTSLLPAKAFELSTTSHHQTNNNELNEFKSSLIIGAANRIIILLP